MTRSDLTHIYFLLDRSGSMQSIRDDTEGGFDAFIAEQRSQPGDCRVTLAQFDDQYEEVYQDVPVADVPPLSLSPRGSTALLDSIGRLLGEAGTRLAALPDAAIFRRLAPPDLAGQPAPAQRAPDHRAHAFGEPQGHQFPFVVAPGQ